MKLLVLIALVISTQFAYGAVGKAERPHPIECCKSPESSRISEEIKKARREGRSIYADPSLQARVLRMLDLQFREMNIHLDSTSAAILIASNPEALLTEVQRMHSVFKDPATTDKEKKLAVKSWALIEKASKNINLLFSNEAEARRHEEDVPTTIEISRIIASLDSGEAFKTFVQEYERAITNAKSVQESIHIASKGEFTEGELRESFRAVAELPPTKPGTMKDATVYVEYDNGILYYHSNFVTRAQANDGKLIKLPTKVKSDPKNDSVAADPGSIFSKMVSAENSDSAAARRALKEDVQVLLDVSIFDAAGVPKIDLTDIKNIRIVNARRNRTFEISPETMATSRPPPSIIAKIKGCCLYGRPPHLSARMSEELAKWRFDAKKIKIASLFVESATDREIERSDLVREIRAKGDSGHLKSAADLKKIFDDAKGNTLVLLGHVEGADYVIRTSANVEQLRIPIANVRAMAKASGVQLIDIGCQTTKAISEESFGVGVMTSYNSVDAVKSLERALKTSTTFEDFLVNVSSEGLKIVIEPSFFSDPVKTAPVFSRIRNVGKAAWVKVAQVTFSQFK